MKPFVAAIVATHRRPEKLRCLLRSLTESTTPFGIFVVDNADDPETAKVIENFPEMEVVRLIPGNNIGVGAALAFGQQEALARWGDRITHLLALDDDAEVAPDAFQQTIDAMEAEGAAMACPLIIDANGHLGWLPGIIGPNSIAFLRKLHSRPQKKETYIELFGDSPRPFSWATGVFLMVKREVVEALGFYATNYWMRGEDFEYSLRFTEKHKGILVPKAVIFHLPPPVENSAANNAGERTKQLAMLQNCTYLSLHVPHGKRILRFLPGNFYRFYRNWGIGYTLKAVQAFWRGGIAKKPAGMTPRL